jgi:hypothetical protein
MADEEKKTAEEAKPGGEAHKSKAHRHRSKHAAGKGKKDGGMVTKVVATVFGAVVAPILVALGIQWVKEKPAAPPTEPPKQTEPAKPKTFLEMVNRNFGADFYIFTWDPELEKSVRKETIDPVYFRYEEKPPRIVVTGGPIKEERVHNAILLTKNDFEDFTLHFWYRWGEKQWGSQEEKPHARKAAILLRTGPDGKFNDEASWPECVNVMLGDGNCGSIRLRGAPGVVKCMARVRERDGMRDLNFRARHTWFLTTQNLLGPAAGTGPAPYLLGAAVLTIGDKQRPHQFREYVGESAEPTLQETGVPRQWSDYILRLNFPPNAYLGRGNNFVGEGVVSGWHPDGDPAIKTVRPPYRPGEWNKVRIDCIKDTVRVVVNTKLVNEITGLNLRKGRIGFASQGAEYEIGQIDVEIKTPEKEAEKDPEKPPRKGRS